VPDPGAPSGLDLGPEDRRRLFAALSATFAARGYGGTEWRHLVEASGIAEVGFGTLFADCEDCFAQAYDHAIDSAREVILGSAPASSSWPVRLAAGLRSALVLIDSHPAEARLVLLEACAATRAIMGHHMATIDSLAPFFAEAREATPEESRPPKLLDTILPGAIAYMLAHHLRYRSEQPLISLYSEALHLLALPYLGDDATASFVAAAGELAIG
jgi:AcrR family transcriptional regulator